MCQSRFLRVILVSLVVTLVSGCDGTSKPDVGTSVSETGTSHSKLVFTGIDSGYRGEDSTDD